MTLLLNYEESQDAPQPRASIRIRETAQGWEAWARLGQLSVAYIEPCVTALQASIALGEAITAKLERHDKDALEFKRRTGNVTAILLQQPPAPEVFNTTPGPRCGCGW